MNYKEQYEQLISTRKLLDRKKKNGIYYEKHHIIPKACGGTNEECNFILLTAKEHYIAHLLLTKMYDGDIKNKMVYALWRFSNSRSHSSKPILSSSQYETARKLFIESKSKRIVSQTTKNKMSASQLKRGKRDSSLGIKISQSKTGNSGKKLKGKSYEDIYGKERANELKEIRRKDRAGKKFEEIYGKDKAILQKQKLSLAHIGEKQTKERIEKARISNQEKRGKIKERDDDETERS